MRGDIQLKGVPPVPPLGKTLVCIEICRDPISGLQSDCSPNLPQSVQVELVFVCLSTDIGSQFQRSLSFMTSTKFMKLPQEHSKKFPQV